MDKQQQFDQLFQEHYSKVFRLCKGYFNGDSHLAEDATQEAFIRIWENLNTFRNESSISTWIYKITANTCLLYLRNKKSKKEVITNLFSDVSTENFSEETEIKLQKMYKCIQQLDEISKMIILMTLEGIEYPEISEVVGISEETLRVRIHRIKKKLTQCVQQ